MNEIRGRVEGKVAIVTGAGSTPGPGPRASSYYTNAQGRSAVSCPFPGNEMWHRLRTPDFADLIVT